MPRSLQILTMPMVLAAVLAMLGGCGQQGPLYLPSTPAPKVPAPSAAAPAPVASQAQ